MIVLGTRREAKPGEVIAAPIGDAHRNLHKLSVKIVRQATRSEWVACVEQHGGFVDDGDWFPFYYEVLTD